MSVNNSIPVAYRRFSGYVDPRYPDGQWLGSVTLSGDASGGNAVASLIFAEATDARLNSRFFTLEELGLSVSGTDSAATAQVATDNLGRDGPAAFQHRMFFGLQSYASAGVIQLAPRDLGFLPIVLGAMRVPLIQTRLFVRLPNPGVGDDIRFEAAGYFWGSRSILVDGGPQRPPTGLYKA